MDRHALARDAVDATGCAGGLLPLRNFEVAIVKVSCVVNRAVSNDGMVVSVLVVWTSFINYERNPPI